MASHIYLVRIRNDGCKELRTPSSPNASCPLYCSIPSIFRPPTDLYLFFPSLQIPFHLLIQYPLQCAFRNAQVASTHPFVEAPDPLVPHNLLYTIPTVLVLPHSLAAASLLSYRLIEL
jgi:hypothetical protein